MAKMKLSDLEGKTLIVLQAAEWEMLLQDVSMGYPGGDKFVVRGSGYQDDGGGHLEISVLKEERLT